MGAKILRFSNMEGDTLRVTFSGANVSDGELIPATSPVTLQMDGGGGEYSAVKYTTATVSVLCDGLQLLELYASRPLDVSVDVTNETTEELLFAGYVSPNTYNQPLTGINDTLAIECVDCLGIAKYVQYKLVDEAKGFQSLSIGEALSHVSSLIGAGDIYYNDFVVIENSTTTLSSYEKLQLLESYFFSNACIPEVLPDGSPSFTPLAKTCFDVLAMIASSFRATFIQMGKDLYLCDQLSTATPLGNRFQHEGNFSKCGKLLYLEEELFAEGSTSVSVLPRHSSFSLDLSRGGEISLLPAFLDSSLLTTSSANIAETMTVGGKERNFLVNLLDSQACNLQASAEKAPSTPASRIIAYRERSEAGEPIGPNASWLDDKFPWEKVLRMTLPSNMMSRVKLLSFKKEFSQSAISSGLWALDLSISVAFGTKTDYFAPAEIDKNNTFELFLVVRCGDKYLYGNEWRSTPITMPSAEHRLLFSEESEWRTKYTTYDSLGGWGLNCSNLVLSIPGGEIEVELWGGQTSGSAIPQWRVCYVKEFDVKMVRSDVLHAWTTYLPAKRNVGEYDYANSAEVVELPLSFGIPGGERPFGTLIDGVEFLETDPNTIPTWHLLGELKFRQGHTMIERLAALGNFGDGTEIELPLCDKHNNAITPLTAIASSQWQGNKVVVAITKDLSESTATVTLN